jgi:hypothetical protein
MPPFFPARLHYLRNRVDGCRSLREMDVVVRAWHCNVTFATAKKLPLLAARTAAILVHRNRGGPERAAQNILNNEKVFTVVAG